MIKNRRFAVQLALALGVALGVSGCASAEPQASPTPSESSAPAPTETTTAPVNEFTCDDPVPTGGAPTAEEMERYRASIITANSQAMASTSCSMLTLAIAGGDAQRLQRDDALVQWAALMNPGAANWTFEIDAATLQNWRSHSFGKYVPEGAIVALDRSSNQVVSVLFDGNVITALFSGNAAEMSR